MKTVKNFIALAGVFLPGMTNAYYCDWDQCQHDQYCCGSNQCCDYVFRLWYFWMGLIGILLSVAACCGVLRLCMRRNSFIVVTNYIRVPTSPTHSDYPPDQPPSYSAELDDVLTSVKGSSGGQHGDVI